MQDSTKRMTVKVRLGATLVMLAAAWLLALVEVPSARAGLAAGLCQSPTTDRGSIPSNFAVEACFDGSKMVIRNNLGIAMGVAFSGSVASPTRTESNYDLAVDATREVSTDSDILLPGDTLTFPVGAGAATFRLRGTSDDGFYLLASGVATLIPGKTTAVVQAFIGLVDEINDDFDQYANCETSTSRIHRAGCHILLVRNVAYAGARFVTHGALAVAKSNLGKILGVFDSGDELAQWMEDHTTGLAALIDSPTISLAATASAETGGGGAPAGGGSTTPSGGGSTTTTPAGGGTTTPSGGGDGTTAPGVGPATGGGSTTTPTVGSVSETVGGVTHTWTDYSNAGGNEGAEIPTGQTVQVTCKVPGFAVADGDTWWYQIASSPWSDQYYASADAFYNDGATSGSLLGTPFVDAAVPDCPGSSVPPTTTTPAPAPTWAETVGGVTHTWTNYSNAGGNEGPSIQTGQTVQIACKVPGFAVADGDTWWYEIASSPWSDQYYASADAFYNNGATTGSLHGTPFVDNSVANC